MDKIIILGAGPYQLHLIEQAKALGNYVITITPEGDYPGIKVADKTYYHDAKDEEYALWVAQTENVNGIISDQGDIFVRPVAYVAEKMGLPGNGYETAKLYTNKYRMRQRSKELGLATIESRLVRTLDEAKQAYRDLGGETIIKPVDASSSRGVYKVFSEDELIAHWDEAKETSRSGDVILEQFINGPQYEVDSIAVKGHVVPLMYADLKEFNIPNVFSSATRLYPSVADDETVRRLLEYSNKINEGFGMIQGISHNEYIIDEKTGEIYLIECALRGGGTFIASDIAYLSTGIDTADFLVKVALGKLDDVPEFQMNRCHCGYAAFYMPAGEVLSTEGLEEVKALDYVVNMKMNGICVGKHLGAMEDKNQRHAIVLYADTREELLARIEHLKELIKFRVKTDKGIEGPIWE